MGKLTEAIANIVGEFSARFLPDVSSPTFVWLRAPSFLAGPKIGARHMRPPSDDTLALTEGLQRAFAFSCGSARLPFPPPMKFERGIQKWLFHTIL